MLNRWKIIIPVVALYCSSFSSTPNSMIFSDFPLFYDNAWQGYKNSTVEHYRIDSLVLVSGMLGEYGKTVVFFESNQPKLEGNYLNTINGYIAQSKSYFTFDNDNNGYTTVNYEKNPQSGTWDKSDSMNLRFNTYNTFVSMVSCILDNAGKQPETRLMNVYRNGNNRVDSVILNISGVVSGIQLTKKMKYTYLYDSQNRYTFRIDTTKMDVSGVPDNSSLTVTRHVFSYTPAAMIIVSEDLSNIGWSAKDSIYAPLLNDSTLSSEEKYSWNNTTSKWVKSLRKEYAYNTNGTCATETNFGKNADNAWTIISKTCFFYDNYSGPVLPSLDESGISMKMRRVDNKIINRTAIITHAGKYGPGQVYTLTGKKSMRTGSLFQSAVQRLIKE